VRRRLAAAVSGCVLAVAASACSGSFTVPSPTTSPPTTAAGATVGSTLTLNDGTGDTVDVTLLKFQDPARPTSHSDTPPPGDALVEVVIKVTGVGGTFEDDVDTAVAVVGSEGQVYAAVPGGLAGCTSFAPVQFTLTAGHSITGCVAVVVRNAVKLSKVEYDAGTVGTTGVWNT